MIPDVFAPMAPPQPSFVAGIRWDHSAPGDIEFHVGRDTFGDTVTGQRQAAGSMTHALDSGWIAVELVGEAVGFNSTIQWTVAGGVPSPLTCGNGAYGPVCRVQVYARAIGASLRIRWRNVVVVSQEDGAAEQRIAVDDESNPVADTMGLTVPAAAKGTFELILTNTGSRRLTVSGQVRLQAAAPFILSRAQLAGQIRVWAQPTPAAARAAARRSLLARLT